MRKADLIDAILAAANGGERVRAQPSRPPSAAAKPRRVRSARASQVDGDDLAALADEENALGGDATDDEPPMPRPRARRGRAAHRSTADDDRATATGDADADADPRRRRATPTRGDVDDDAGADDSDSGTDDGRRPAPTATRVDPEDERQSFGEGNRRGGAGVAAAAARTSRRGDGRAGRVPGRADRRRRACSTSATRATASSARAATSPAANDVYVSASQVRRFALRKGDYVKGATRPQASNEKYPALLRVDDINGMTPDDARARPRFEDLTPLFPDDEAAPRAARRPERDHRPHRRPHLADRQGPARADRVAAEGGQDHDPQADRLLDRAQQPRGAPHGAARRRAARRGHRHAAPRAARRGRRVARSTARPTSTRQVAELAIERAKRLVEMGKDVVIVLDGITRLARAYNLAAPASGRIMSGGVDSAALYPPKKFFGAARNIEEGGSLTILATALIETGARRWTR